VSAVKYLEQRVEGGFSRGPGSIRQRNLGCFFAERVRRGDEEVTGSGY